MSLNPFIYDIEVFPNYFLLDLYRNGKHWIYEDPNQVMALLDRSSDIVFCGFNNKAYDDVILTHIWQGNTTLDSIYELSNRLITSEDWETDREIKFAKRPWSFSIDMFQLLNKKAGLKEWECNAHYRTVRECPVSFNAPLPPEMVADVRKYCANDTEATHYLFQKNYSAIEIRQKLQEKFSVSTRVYCMGDARVAEEIFVTDFCKRMSTSRSKIKELIPPTESEYLGLDIALECINYQTPEFQDFYHAFRESKIAKSTETTSKGGWKIVSDRDGVRKIRGKAAREVAVSWFADLPLAGRVFKMGVGGLHTVDGPGYFESDNETVIIDADVTSYYPSLIVNHHLTPPHLPGMRDTYEKVLKDRIAAKASGDKITADAYKLIANSTFGKFSEKFSLLKSVKTALQITLNGQLMILMLIERLHMAGIEILSANTDGVTVRAPVGFDLRKEIFTQWEADTKMSLELATYKKYARRDVNNYIAITDSGKIKCKGDINDETLNTSGAIVKNAVKQYFVDGTIPEKTIESCTVFTDFIYYQHSKKNSELYLDGQMIGKTARWYMCKVGGTIKRANNRTLGAFTKIMSPCRLCLDLPEGMPDDVFHQYYIDEAWKLIRAIKPLRITK